MFFDEHSPPHFHAEYGEFKASVNILSLEIMEGKLPRRALALVLDWAELHQNELKEDWEICRQHQPGRSGRALFAKPDACHAGIPTEEMNGVKKVGFRFALPDLLDWTFAKLNNGF